MAQAHALATGSSYASRYGQTQVVQTPLSNSLYSNCTTSGFSLLAEATTTSLLEELTRRGGDLDDDQEGGLADLVTTMVAMAEGTATPSFYLSSLDPGVGKTTALICFIQHLLRSHSHGHISALICASRIDEIKRLVDEMGLLPSDFAVLTSDEEANALSGTASDQARVLFTTHEMVYKSCSDRMFSDVDAFKYQGQVRDVRIWDETAVPGKSVSISTDDLAALRGPLRSGHPALAAEVERLEVAIRDADLLVPFSFPDIQAVSGVSRRAAQLGQNQTHKDQLEVLYAFSSKPVLLRKRDNRSKVITALDTRDALPADLAPMVILDASGRLKTTYDQWEKAQGNLVRLKEATRHYGKLTINFLEKGGSQSSWNANGQDLAKEVAAMINTKPGEQWLVVYPKAACGGSIPDQIKGLVSMDPELVSFLNWGQHQATNAYRHISNVILAGTLFYTDADYEMMVRACGCIPINQAIPPGSLDRMKAGEDRHHIFQALCRSSVRQGSGASCGPCNAYIIASKTSGIRDLLPSIFPGCVIKDCKATELKLTGKVAEAVSYIETFFKDCRDGVLPFQEVRDQIGYSATNFTKRIRKHESFKQALERMGINEVISGKGRHANTYALQPEAFGPVSGSVYVAND